ncbi:hypothetical protein KO516_11215 [Citreicella sp. C3M06]|uniref:hypothetical protein n=1 Tax=Roseobacteraceae TaxID=2854170 RepID=UPI001C087F84|nr:MULTISPECIES: hypothetical protein [Roseobacteraceae]MBU2961378.1 hypothetical protein [Citreicella sp. C3M06]MDO6584719.1 hypothetical protein [Salipiger sp. 1_MG-2023]
MAHLDLTHFPRVHFNPFGFFARFGKAFSEALHMSRVAEDAMARGETGEALHKTLQREWNALN